MYPAPKPWGALLTLAVYSGLREGEILGLEWRDLDLDAETPRLKVRQSWDRIEGKLSFEGEVIKTIQRIGVAKNVVPVLDTFQELGWPARVDSPLSPDSQKHHATIVSLSATIQKLLKNFAGHCSLTARSLSGTGILSPKDIMPLWMNFRL